MFTVAVTYMLPINEPVIVYRPNGGFGVGRGWGGGVWMICNDMVFRGERKTENGGGISLRQQSVKGGTILK